MADKYWHAALLDDGETEVEVQIQVHSWGCPAQTYGPPERCWPAEPPEVEIIRAELVEDAKPKPDVLPSLTDAERYRIEREFIENPPEDDYD